MTLQEKNNFLESKTAYDIAKTAKQASYVATAATVGLVTWLAITKAFFNLAPLTPVALVYSLYSRTFKWPAAFITPITLPHGINVGKELGKKLFKDGFNFTDVFYDSLCETIKMDRKTVEEKTLKIYKRSKIPGRQDIIDIIPNLPNDSLHTLYAINKFADRGANDNWFGLSMQKIEQIHGLEISDSKEKTLIYKRLNELIESIGKIKKAEKVMPRTRKFFVDSNKASNIKQIECEKIL